MGDVMKKDIELLAPAGNIDSFKAAINAGADAIYMGLDKFNAREMAKNFDMESFIDCIKRAHILEAKVYLTLNILLHDDEIKEALELVTKLYLAGLDAVIIQDIGLASLIHEIIPKLPLHASTQMSVYNIEQVKFLEKLGFKRVVLARELTLPEIEYICDNTNLEIEVFVHGALCVCYSGQCLLSEVIGGRSANRGSCAQPCRMKYNLFKGKNRIVQNRYLLSKKDIFGIEYLSKLQSIGVTSLKIEGRNKTPEYVAGVTKTYRNYLDRILNFNNQSIDLQKEDEKYLLQIFNRDGKSSGYLDGVRYKETITQNIPKNTGIFLGNVLMQKNCYIKVKLEEDIDMHDGIEIIDKNEVIYSNIVTCIKDEGKNIVNQMVKKGSIVWLGDISKKVEAGAKIYKTSSNSINLDLKKYYDRSFTRKKKIDVQIVIKENKKIYAKTLNLNKNVLVNIDYIPQKALKKDLLKEDVINCFSKTNDTLFEFNILKFDIDSNIFVPTSILNELRRMLILNIYNSFDKKDKNDIVNYNLNETSLKAFQNIKTKTNNNNKNTKTNILHVYRYNDKIDYIQYYKQKYNRDLDLLYIDIVDIYKNKSKILEKYKNKVDILVMLPNIGGENIDKYIFKNLEELVNDGVKGFVVGNVGYIDTVLNLKKKYNITLVADYTLNIYNSFSVTLYNNLDFDVICPSLELTEEEVGMLGYKNIEVVSDLQTVMTSRYCILGAYVAGRKMADKCSMPCVKGNYYLKDSYNKRYDLVCNNIDCIMRIVAQRNRFNNTSYRVRREIL